MSETRKAPVPKLERLPSSASPAALMAALQKWADAISALLSGRLELPDLGPQGEVVLGHFALGISRNTFTAANTDTLFTHQFGFRVNNWIVCRKSAVGDIYDGSVPSNQNGVVLRCSAAPVTATILVFGRRP